MNLNSYINSDKEVSIEALQETMSRIRSVMATEWRDIDTTPSSPFGNLVLVPLAKTIALYEDAANCVLSDVVLENAVNGVACNCEFVKKFITGLGLSSLLEANSTGIVRFVYNRKPSDYPLDNKSADPSYVKTDDDGFKYFEIDQGSVLGFSNTYVLHPYAAKPGVIRIYDPIDPIAAKENKVKQPDTSINMKYLSLSEDGDKYFVDIPVYGTPDAEIAVGASGTIDKTEEELEDLIMDITLVSGMIPYSFPEKLSELMDLFKQIYPSSNFSTKLGTVSYIKKKFPKVDCISPVYSKVDPENIRSGTTPSLDVYVKSYQSLMEITQGIRVYCQSINSDKSTWIGYVNNANYIYKLKTFSSFDGSIVDLTTEKDVDIELISQNINTKLPGLSYCGTEYEKFLIKITIPHSKKAEYLGDETGADSFKNLNDQDNETPTSGFLRITYLTDPYLNVISNYISAAEVQPFLDTQIKNFVNYTIEQLDITYYKQQGKYMDRVQAVDDIITLVNNLSYPYNFDNAYLTDIMLLHGAYGVKSINIIGSIRLTEATKRITVSSLSKEALTTAETQDISYLPISTNEILNVSWNLESDFVYVGERNIAYYLEKDKVNLIEQKL